jgi:ubiquinone/menaquinone biosynthesis C-methylase UbiE
MMSRDYFNRRADIWDEAVAEKDPGKLMTMVRRMGLEGGTRVLDVGTGTGVLLPFLVDAVGGDGHIVALDFAELMLRRARSKQSRDTVSYLLADIGALPAAPGSFDVVVCYSSFPHFPDKVRALFEIHRVTRTGGRLLICHTSSRHSINQTHRKIPAVNKDLLPTDRLMHSMLATAGFGEVKIEDTGDSYLASATRSEH